VKERPGFPARPSTAESGKFSEGHADAWICDARGPTITLCKSLNGLEPLLPMDLFARPYAFEIAFKCDAPLLRGEPFFDAFRKSFQTALSATYAESLFN
jgi:hypothetical protein